MDKRYDPMVYQVLEAIARAIDKSIPCDDHDACEQGPCKQGETAREYAKRIKERDDAHDQRWTSGDVEGESNG